MSVALRDADDRTVVYTKGAPESLLERCAFEQRPNEIVPLTPVRREELLQASREMADRALRVLGLAWREVEGPDKTQSERDLIFVGLVGMIDPPREEARIAVGKCPIRRHPPGHDHGRSSGNRAGHRARIWASRARGTWR